MAKKILVVVLSLFLLGALITACTNTTPDNNLAAMDLENYSETAVVELPQNGSVEPLDSPLLRGVTREMQVITFPDIPPIPVVPGPAEPVVPVIPEEPGTPTEPVEPEIKVLRIYGDPTFRYEAKNASIDGGAITYSSDDENIAIVDENTGLVTIVGAGTTRIIATAAEVPNLWVETQASYTLVVAKAEGSGTVTITGWIVGRFDSAVNSPVFSNVTEEYAAPAIEYSVRDANSWSTNIPTEVGEYTVRATWAETANFLGYVATSDFTISPEKEVDTTINISQITLTAPVTGARPVTSIDTAQFTGTVTWSPNHSTFQERTVYTATINITPKTNFTLDGVSANFFTVTGTSSPATNAANSGVVTAVFPETGPAVKSVAVGAQSGTLVAGVAGNVTFPVATVNIANGTYDVTVSNLPTGVTIGNSGRVTINNNSGTLTLEGNTSTVNVTRNNLVLTIDDAPSGNFTLVITEAPPEPPEHISVTSIDGIPSTILAGESLRLSGNVYPSNATFQTIIWTVYDPGTTGAVISDNTLYTTDAGLVVIEATIEKGIAPDRPYTQLFEISVDIQVETTPPSENIAHRVTMQFGSWDGSGNAIGIVDADYHNFVRLLRGNQEVAATNYTVHPGSTVITLNESYLATLPDGTHTFHAEFTDGYADLTITVRAAGAAADTTPQGGNTNNILLIAFIVVIVILVALCIYLWVRYRKN